MDASLGGAHAFSHLSTTSSSAVDLSNTRPGISSSPTLRPSDTHRRLSWSSTEDRLEEPSSSSSVDHSRRRVPSFLDVPPSRLPLTQDPDADTVPEDDDDDDRTRLTRGAQLGMDPEWPTSFSVDPERTAGFTSPPRRQYTASHMTETVVNAFRRASTRVANDLDQPYISLRADGEYSADRTQPSTFLRGRALGILGPKNPLRMWLRNLFTHPYTDPTILTLIVVNAVALVVQASRTLLLPPDDIPVIVRGYFHAWEDFVIFILFIIFTIEFLGRICLSGLFLDPDVQTLSLFSALIRQPVSSTGGYSLRGAYRNVARGLSIPLSSHARPSPPVPIPAHAPSSVSHNQSHSQDLGEPTVLSRVMRSDVIVADPDDVPLPFRLDLQVAQSKIERNIPYLRQGWGRIDFLAVTGFWISFALATVGLERGTHQIGIFRALSVLKTARLLAVTDGTATIMRSLKIARPLLANVIYFITFATVLFSVIGVQSFKGSLRRSCTLLPVLGASSTRLGQSCGGHINATTLAPSPYLLADGMPASATKGYICPLGQVCQEGENPFKGVESFDTVYYAALQIVVLASASSWSGVMYQIIASEYHIASIFFIFGVLVLNFWLFKLLVGVITNSFSAIRAGTKRSAFGAAPIAKEDWFILTGRHIGQNQLKIWWSYTHWLWVLLALASLVVQATATADMSSRHQQIVDIIESVLTIAFDIEILVRIAVELPAWRDFFLHLSNWLDLIVAIGCTIIQIPAIHSSKVYPWLTVFQLARFYRVLLVVPRMKPLMLTVFGNMYGLVNMTVFLMLITFLAALFAIQLIQGDLPGTTALNFSQLFNSFLGVYQILSGDNWTALLYDVIVAELSVKQAVVVSMFLCCWLLFSNFVVMQMFIAVINENFSAAEATNRERRAKQQPKATSRRWISKLNPYRLLKKKLMPENAESPHSTTVPGTPETLAQHDTPDMDNELDKGPVGDDSIPLRDLPQTPESGESVNTAKHEDDRHFVHQSGESHYALPSEFEIIFARPKRTPSTVSEETHRTETQELIENHPTYDKSLWIFPHQNPLRHFCQKMVRPSGGKRIRGSPHSEIALTFFHVAILLVVLASVITEGIANPLYRRNYYMQHGPTRGAWFNIVDVIFTLVLIVEFLVKIVADGFLFAPNAYIRSSWNILDFAIMIGTLVNVTFTLVLIKGLSRFIRALRALQALRFMTTINKMRKTFEEDLTLVGFMRILEAAVLAMLYIIPFSVWGTNIFAGLMNECNDSGVKGIRDCTNEYVNTFYGDNFGFPVPRVWDNPSPSTTFSFDSFPASLLILFEIVSKTGWINVMSVAMSITGEGLQPQTNASQANAIFFVLYNLLGAVVVLTLFVSIIIGNFSSLTGAYVTEAQRAWIDLQKVIKRLKPSRFYHKPTSPFQIWCWRRAISKRGWWMRMMTVVFAVQTIVLMTQAYSPETATDWHNIVSLIISLIYVGDVLVRLHGLGWASFRGNNWNLFDVIVAFGSFGTTLFVHFHPGDRQIEFLQKLFLVSMALKLVQLVAPLNQLFESGVNSLPVILNLLGLWLTLFLFFDIMYMEVFGLTKWYSAENSFQNYQTMPSAFLMLVSLSTGEGWNQFMHDYALTYPRCTQLFEDDYQTDCGSTPWAYSMFIAWNLLSMYIFVNIFTALIVESFSYVFQSSSGALKSIGRRETRTFKKAWAQFANPKNHLLERQNLGPFLAKLDGSIQVRIFPSKYSTPRIVAACRSTADKYKATDGVSLRKLDEELSKIDFEAIQKRRVVYMRIYHEATLMCYRRATKGIKFSEMLVLLAHHTLIDDHLALVSKERKERERTLRMVENLVTLDMVRSQMQTVLVRRRYLKHKAMRQGSLPDVDTEELPRLVTTAAWRDAVHIRRNDSKNSGEEEYDVSSSPSSSGTRPPTPEVEDGRSVSPDSLLEDDEDVAHSPTRQHSEEVGLLRAEVHEA